MFDLTPTLRTLDWNWMKKKKLPPYESAAYAHFNDVNSEPQYERHCFCLNWTNNTKLRGGANNSFAYEMWIDGLFGTPTHLVVHQSHHSNWIRLVTHTRSEKAFSLCNTFSSVVLFWKRKRKSPFLAPFWSATNEGTTKVKQTKNQANDRAENVFCTFSYRNEQQQQQQQKYSFHRRQTMAL